MGVLDEGQGSSLSSSIVSVHGNELFTVVIVETGNGDLALCIYGFCLEKNLISLNLF